MAQCCPIRAGPRPIKSGMAHCCAHEVICINSSEGKEEAPAIKAAPPCVLFASLCLCRCLRLEFSMSYITTSVLHISLSHGLFNQHLNASQTHHSAWVHGPASQIIHESHDPTPLKNNGVYGSATTSHQSVRGLPEPHSGPFEPVRAQNQKPHAASPHAVLPS